MTTLLDPCDYVGIHHYSTDLGTGRRCPDHRRERFGLHKFAMELDYPLIGRNIQTTGEIWVARGVAVQPDRRDVFTRLQTNFSITTGTRLSAPVHGVHVPPVRSRPLAEVAVLEAEPVHAPAAVPGDLRHHLPTCAWRLNLNRAIADVVIVAAPVLAFHLQASVGLQQVACVAAGAPQDSRASLLQTPILTLLWKVCAAPRCRRRGLSWQPLAVHKAVAVSPTNLGKRGVVGRRRPSLLGLIGTTS
mmetsp:Transcript_85796/g.237634  ORF Transcript_85796/g.237634 Transcript_85796/m.237634 type:complete len:246 (+) Transcript_85796:414-1151(+)